MMAKMVMQITHIKPMKLLPKLTHYAWTVIGLSVSGLLVLALITFGALHHNKHPRGYAETASVSSVDHVRKSGEIMAPIPEEIALPHGWLLVKVPSNQAFTTKQLDAVLETNGWKSATSQGIVIIRQMETNGIEVVRNQHEPFWPTP
jgi:hypothetical protein